MGSKMNIINFGSIMTGDCDCLAFRINKDKFCSKVGRDSFAFKMLLIYASQKPLPDHLDFFISYFMHYQSGTVKWVKAK